MAQSKKENIRYYMAAGIGLALLLLPSKKTYANFKLSDFDSADLPGSGKNMNTNTLSMLNQAEIIAGFPFVYESGYRTPEHNQAVGGVLDSSHVGGYGVDIDTNGIEHAKKVSKALYKAGFRRFGINLTGTLVHADNDPGKPTPALWGYSGFYAPFNPSLL